MSTSGFPYRPQSESLISEVTRFFTPDVVRGAASMSGESESSASRALQASVPTVLSGVTNMASSSEGASSLTGMIREGNYGGLVENPMSVFRGGSATNYLISAGQRHLGKIFGNDLSSVVETVSKTSGTGTSSTTKLLALATPLILGVLGKRTSTPGSPSLTDTLLRQKDDFEAAAPAGLSRILGLGPRAVTTTTTTRVERGTSPDAPAPTHIEHFAEPTAAPPAPVPEELRTVRTGGGLRWLPFLLLLLAVIGLLGWLLSRARAPRVGELATHGVNTATNALNNLALPGGVNLNVAPGSINYNLARYLADPSAPTPRTFVFDHLNFESGSTQLTGDSEKTVSDLAQVLKAYPNAAVQLTGHADSTGDPAANRTLSMNRANAVRDMLVTDGVGADRISTQGAGQEQPVATNDTAQGRAENRNTELTVTRK
jgi:OmpA-OmpF porin, OOP family